MIFGTSFALKSYFQFKTKKERHHWILYIRFSLGIKFQLTLTISIFCTKIELKLTFWIFLVQIFPKRVFPVNWQLWFFGPTLSLSWQFRFLGPNWPKKIISSWKKKWILLWILHIWFKFQISASTDKSNFWTWFEHKLTILIYWNKFDQKGCFWLQIELCIFSLI